MGFTKLVLGLWLFLIPLSTWAKPMLRQTKGLHGLELDVGKAAIGKLISLDWSYGFSAYWQIKCGLATEYCKQETRVYTKVFTQPRVSYSLYSNERNVFMRALSGLIFLYEHSQSNQGEEGGFNIGIVVGEETGIFLFRKMELVIGIGGRVYFLKSPYGRLDYYLSLGLKLTF